MRIDTVMAIKFGDRTGLPEVVDPERAGAMSVYRTQPAERCRMAIDDRDDTAMGWKIGQ